MPDWIAVLLLGVIEGITEFLPVSSTGHLLIVESLFRAGGLLGETHWLVVGGGAKDLFNIVIQSGAVLAVLPLFPDRLHQFAFKWRERATQDYALKILVAFVLTGVGGLILEKKGFKLPDEAGPVAWALLIGGIGFVAIEGWLRGRKLSDEITWTIAISVGLGQLIAAVFPGTSRSGATILCCLLLGLNRPAATEFSFLVGIPTMLAAGGLKIFKALHDPPPGSLPAHWDMVLLGFVVSAVVSFIAVKWLLRYVQTHTFVIFGWYRMAAAVVIFAMLFWNSSALK
jgi:undecaprenyl-diphosphatase